MEERKHLVSISYGKRSPYSTKINNELHLTPLKNFTGWSQPGDRTQQSSELQGSVCSPCKYMFPDALHLVSPRVFLAKTLLWNKRNKCVRTCPWVKIKGQVTGLTNETVCTSIITNNSKFKGLDSHRREIATQICELKNSNPKLKWEEHAAIFSSHRGFF